MTRHGTNPSDDAVRGDAPGGGNRWAALLAHPGVVGVGEGRTAEGDDAIVVFVADSRAAAALPDHVGGLPVEVVVSGPIEAQ